MAEQGFSGLMIGCIAWYDALKTIQDKREPWKRARLKGLHDNWIFYNMFGKNGEWNDHNPKLSSQPADWFDDDLFNSMADNMRMTVRFAKQVQSRGLAVDIESYGNTPLATKPWADRPAAATEKAHQRGRELAQVMIKEFPDIELLVLPAYYAWNGLREVIGVRRYAEPFILGMAELFAQRQSLKGRGEFLPASEFTYGPVGDMNAESCLGRVDWILQQLQGPFASFAKQHPNYYKQRIHLAPGVWPGGDYLGDEGSDGQNRRYSPQDHRNMLSACRQRGVPVVWVYGQNWAWYTSAWREYAEVHQRFRSATQYNVYEVGRKSNNRIVTTPSLHVRFSSADPDRNFLVRAAQPADPEDANEVPFQPRSVKGLADDFDDADGLGPRWLISSSPQGQAPSKPSGSKALSFSIRKSDQERTDIRVSLDDRPRTQGSAWLTARSFRQQDENNLTGVGLRIFSDENHWALLERSGNGFRLRWRNGNQQKTKGVGYINNGPGGEFGLA